MSLINNARASQVVKNMKSGQYHSKGKWHGYGTIAEDKPSWDYRLQPCGAEIIAQRKIRMGANK